MASWSYMERLLWIGNPYFAPELQSAGWKEVRILDFDKPSSYSWNDLVKIAGFKPDILVVADKSLPPPVLGMETFPCLTVFYSVDAHIHSWHPVYAQGFDACLVSLKDKLKDFTGPYLKPEHIWWSPPFAKKDDVPVSDMLKKWDCLFVGSINNELMPKRSRFLADLATKIPSLEIRQGNYRELFPQAKVLINQAERDDMNFRIFEAMGTGSCLVSPRLGHGLPDMFIDGEHLVLYSPNDAGDAAYKIQFLLDHPEITEHIGKEAVKVIDSAHRAIHRAQAFTDHICDLATEGIEDIINKRLQKAAEIRKNCLSVIYLLWANELTDEEMKKAYLQAARA